MANETLITVIGNLTADPELRFTPSGDAVANFTVASTPRTYDKQANEWRDGDPLFLGCSVWRQAAENVTESLTKGMRVIVTGRLKQRSYETREGEKRTVFEIDVEDVGPSLMWASAQVTRTGSHAGTTRPTSTPQASTPTQPGRAPQRPTQQTTRQQPAKQADAWATGGQGSLDDVPPF